MPANNSGAAPPIPIAKESSDYNQMAFKAVFVKNFTMGLTGILFIRYFIASCV
jgi:hypothetical protein